MTPGGSDEEKKLNAKYAISSARKLGCSLFCTYEDILDVKPKMILSYVATLMSFSFMGKPATPQVVEAMAAAEVQKALDWVTLPVEEAENLVHGRVAQDAASSARWHAIQGYSGPFRRLLSLACAPWLPGI